MNGKLEHGDRAKDVWGATPAGHAYGEGLAPGSKEYFETIHKMRTEYEQPWLAALVPFESMTGKRVLEIGCGAGYDAFSFIKAGADYTGIDVAAENIRRTKKHLAHFAMDPDVRHANAEALDFSDATFDAVYSNGVLHHVDDTETAIAEIHRVLKPGGRFWMIVYHRNSIFYRITIGVFTWFLRGNFLRRRLADQLAMIETTESGTLPIVRVYSETEAKRLVEAAGFRVVGSAVRKLTAEDLPAATLLGPIYRLFPVGLLNALGRRWGWYVIVEGEKPVIS